MTRRLKASWSIMGSIPGCCTLTATSRWSGGTARDAVKADRGRVADGAVAEPAEAPPPPLPVRLGGRSTDLWAWAMEDGAMGQGSSRSKASSRVVPAGEPHAARPASTMQRTSAKGDSGMTSWTLGSSCAKGSRHDVFPGREVPT